MNEGISRRPSPSGRQNSIKTNQNQQQQQQRRPSYSPQRPGDASPRPSPRRKSRRRPSPSSSGLPPIIKDNIARRHPQRWWAWAAMALSLSSLLVLLCGAAFWLGRPAGRHGVLINNVPRSLRAAPTTTPMPTTTLKALSSLGMTNDQTAANNKEAQDRSEGEEEELHFGEVIHVIYTRFMQQQPNLLSLGRARLLMFQTFCLPSVMEQTNPDFLWIIRTDPDLAPELRNDLVNLLKDRPNFLLVGSNDNPEDGFRHDSAVQDVLSPTAIVWSGDMEMASKVHRAAQSRIVLETRLDADDGLHVDFARAVQAEAVQALSSRRSSSQSTPDAEGKGADATSSSSPEGGALRLGNGSYGGGARHHKSGAAEKGEESDDDPKWMVWCVDSHVEWHYESPFDHDDAAYANNNEAHHQHPEGYLVGMHAPHCVTPGLTFGYGVGASRSTVSVLPPGASHQDYHKKLAPCDEGKDSKGTIKPSPAASPKASSRCLRRLSVLAPGAIRPRTPTSAGLLDVVINGDALGGPTKVTKMRKALRKTKWEGAQDVLWKGTEKLLAVRRANAKKAVAFLKDHLVDIARDNLTGQCTKGHSCKKESEEFLRRLVKRKEEEGGGETPSEGHKDKRPERIRIRP